MQMLSIGFEDGEFKGWVLAELRRLRHHDVVRLVGLLVVRRNEDASVEKVEQADLTPEEAEHLGALASALLGLETGGEEREEQSGAAGAAATWASELGDKQLWYLADHILPGTTAAIALLEHRWATPLRDAIEATGGVTVVDAWVHPEDLVEIGAVPSRP
jgi:hypothetical protein